MSHAVDSQWIADRLRTTYEMLETVAAEKQRIADMFQQLAFAKSKHDAITLESHDGCPRHDKDGMIDLGALQLAYVEVTLEQQKASLDQQSDRLFNLKRSLCSLERASQRP
ncbi:hypothetical protein ml_205 [Mollivirus sibericum]|uniref:hypothetical protein n=1 Tax=Mollivirus sibericum TaxID=1678078 RepID=UPI0006B2DA32|nr:hypothetical protein ml_205 [Mollivirus sibericum]ALD62007.1 hypothetical protein ml_205 [Mollivirus sibericum]